MCVCVCKVEIASSILSAVAIVNSALPFGMNVCVDQFLKLIIH